MITNNLQYYILAKESVKQAYTEDILYVDHVFTHLHTSKYNDLHVPASFFSWYVKQPISASKTTLK